MEKKRMKVYIDVAPVGDNFAIVGVLRQVGTRRKVAVCDDIAPYGCESAARGDAYKLAIQRGWEVIEDRFPSTK